MGISQNSKIVFLPVKPCYAEKIMAGTKRVEFRKRIWKSNTDIVVIYASSPVKKILGYITVKRITSSNPEIIWKRFHNVAGISHENYMEYFAGHSIAHCIEIDSIFPLSKPIDIHAAGIEGVIPQNFKYLINFNLNQLKQDAKHAILYR